MTGSAVDTAGTVTAADNKSANKPVAILFFMITFLSSVVYCENSTKTSHINSFSHLFYYNTHFSERKVSISYFQKISYILYAHEKHILLRRRPFININIGKRPLSVPIGAESGPVREYIHLFSEVHESGFQTGKTAIRIGEILRTAGIAVGHGHGIAGH